MNDNELRDRIAARTELRGRLSHVIDEALREKRRRECGCTVHEHVAQAIIDDLGLTVDSLFEHKAGSAIELNETLAEYDERVKPRTFHRVVGKWEKK